MAGGILSWILAAVSSETVGILILGGVLFLFAFFLRRRWMLSQVKRAVRDKLAMEVSVTILKVRKSNAFVGMGTASMLEAFLARLSRSYYDIHYQDSDGGERTSIADARFHPISKKLRSIEFPFEGDW